MHSFLVYTGLLVFCFTVHGYPVEEYTNDASSSKGQHLIVLAPPRWNDPYYEQKYGLYENITRFQINYAKQVIGRDNIIIFGDEKNLETFRPELPDDILLQLQLPMQDIWMRDFTTVNPYIPFAFTYTAKAQGGSQALANYVQRVFRETVQAMDVDFYYDPWMWYNDGGNIVDNYEDKIVATKKFMYDNNLTKPSAKAELQYLYQSPTGEETQVALLPMDDALGHADGMVMFLGRDTVALTNYEESPNFREAVLNELHQSFGQSLAIVELPAITYVPGPDPEFSSACGYNVNGVLTENYLYLPVFKSDSPDVIPLIEANTDRTVVPVDADGVCEMGGSVRCLSWQATGNNARLMIEKAREDVTFPN